MDMTAPVRRVCAANEPARCVSAVLQGVDSCTEPSLFAATTQKEEEEEEDLKSHVINQLSVNSAESKKELKCKRLMRRQPYFT